MASAEAFVHGAGEFQCFPLAYLAGFGVTLAQISKGERQALSPCAQDVWLLQGTFCLWLAQVQWLGAAHAHLSALGWGNPKAKELPLDVSAIKDTSRVAGSLC